jgi:hypothetical protein
MATVIHHNTLAGFRAAVSPLKVNMTWDGPAFHQFDEIRNGNHVTHVGGHEFLDEVKVGPILSGNWPTGGDLGQYPIDPVGLCARTAYFAKLFEQNKIHKLRIVYSPSVAATEPGAIALSFSNDTFTEAFAEGLANVSIQSSKEAFVSGPVTQPLALDIHPKLAVSVMYSEDRGNARFTTAGMVTVLAQSDLNEAVPANAKVYGALYVEYEYEFVTPELHQTVPLIQTAQLSVQVGAAVSKAADSPVLYEVTGSDPGDKPWIDSGYLPTGIDVTDLPEYIYVGVIRDSGADTTWDIILEDDNTRYTPARGNPAFFRFVSASNGVTYAVPYGSYGRAADADPNITGGGNIEGTDWRWENASNFTDTSQQLYGRFVQIADMI